MKDFSLFKSKINIVNRCMNVNIEGHLSIVKQFPAWLHRCFPVYIMNGSIQNKDEK